MTESSEFDQEKKKNQGPQISVGGDVGNIHVGDDVHGDKILGDMVSGDKIGEAHYHFPKAPKEPPMEIPRRAQHFHGREELVEDVTREIKPGRVVTLYGIGGIGKTAVVAEVVNRLQESGELLERFPDGVIFHPFSERPLTDVALEHVLNSLGYERWGELEDDARVALGRKRLLLILDGAEEADHLTRLVRLGPSCGILISSRKREDVFDTGFPVKRLEVEKAQKVLAGWAGERAMDERLQVEICDLVGNLPLALRLAGKYLASSGLMVREYRDWLGETGLEALDFGKRQEESIPVLMERSVALVGEGAREALAIAGILALMPFRVEAVAMALEKSRIRAQQELGKLVNYGLVERPDTSYGISHPLVHSYARKALSVNQDQLLKLAGYYENLIREENEKGLEGFARLDEERPHIMQLIQVCRAREEWESVDGLVCNIVDYLDRQGHGAERIEALEAGVRAAQATGNRRDEGTFQGNLGRAYRTIGKVGQAIAHHEQALQIAQEIGNRRGEGNHLGNLGLAYADLGQMERAIDYHEQALQIAQEISDRRGIGHQLGNLGTTYYSLGQVERAIDCHKQALLIAQEIGDRRSEEAWLGSLGFSYAHLGQVERAIDYHKQALKIAQEIGDRRGEGADLGNLGVAYVQLGQVERAIDFYQQALQIAQEIGGKRSEGVWLGNLGNAYVRLGLLEQAINFYKQALDIAQEIGDKRYEGARLRNLGLAYAVIGQLEQAREYLQKCVAIFEEIEDPRAGEVKQILDDLAED